MVLRNDQIREHGIPLSEAWYVFASPPLREAYDLPAEEIKIPEKPAADGWEFAANVANFLRKSIAQPKQHAQRLMDLKAEMQTDLFDWLLERDLFAFGHQISPSEVRNYRKIPSDFWNGARPDWDNDAASDVVRRFHKILVIDPEDFEGFDFEPKIGRRSHKAKIEDAIKALNVEIEDFRTGKTHKEKNALIRERILLKYPKIDVYGYGFGDDAIRKIANAYFNSLQLKK